MADIESAILKGIEATGEINTLELSKTLKVAHQDVVGAVKSLENDSMVVSEKGETQMWSFTAEGNSVAANGSPEFNLWTMLAAGPLDQEVVVSQITKDGCAVALTNGMKSKLFKLDKTGGKITIHRDPTQTSVTDSVKEALLAAQGGKPVDEKTADALKKRKLATMDAVKLFIVRKGPNFSVTRTSTTVSDITKQMIADGSWKNVTMKKYNFEANGKEPKGGHLHPLLKVRQEFREIFLELGFQEMDTAAWVESSFWNFDTLFVPQQHPARDMQDTFFVSKPATSRLPDEAYVNAVASTHEAGYHNAFSRGETIKNVLRTHTTAVSSNVLYQLAQSSPIGPDGKRQFKPGKYFSIDRVFRNEEMDRTHLCEFHQVEGFVVDRNLSLANMMHTLHQFFKRIGIEQLRFKPAYNPYTEPSMEIFGYHSGLKKWMEVGNSGVFRPEMLVPMGFDEDVTAIAWGLSLERPTMIKYELKNIHDLFGHKVDLKFIRKSCIARY